MKKIISIFLCAMLVLQTGIFVFAASENGNENENPTANLSVYEQINHKYLYWDTAVDVSDGRTLLEILNESGLKAAQNDGTTSIGDYADDSENGSWAMIINDNRQNTNLNYKPQSSDRIKLIYEITPQPTPSDTTVKPSQTANDSTVSDTSNASVYQKTTVPSQLSSEATSSQSNTQTTQSTPEPASSDSDKTNADNTSTTQKPTVGTGEMISNAVSYIEKNNGDFTPLALMCHNYCDISGIRDKINDEVKTSSSLKMYDLSRIIINSAAVGLDLTNVGGVNLQNLLINNENVMSSGLKGTIFALLALKHCKTDDEYINTPDTLYGLILQNQNKDGGFANTYGEKSDVYLTAGALIALSDYNSTPAVKTASEKAILYLLNTQNEDGSFNGESGKADCAATAQVIIALRSQNISVDDERFIKQRSVYDSLSDFYNGTAFADNINGENSARASETALLAFYSCNSAPNPYTAKIDSENGHMGGIILFGGAFIVLIASGVMLLIIKRRDKAANQTAEPTESRKDNTDNVDEEVQNRKEK